MSYEVLKNRMNNGTPFLRQMAISRIGVLADNLKITQEQTEELMAIAQSNGMEALPQNFSSRLNMVEQTTKENRQAIEALVDGRRA